MPRDTLPMSSQAHLATRAQRFAELERVQLDVLVIGGGITGAGLALDLVARGLRTALVERDDWASATSSASSRLIHGGLRYLERLEIGLVRDSCLERGLLLRNAAGLVWPETFVFPVHRGGPTGRLKLAAGLLAYTLVSVPRVLGLPRLLGARSVAQRIPGVRAPDLVGGGAYLDGATLDARLTLSVALSALGRGALALSRVEALNVENGRGGARVQLCDRLSGREFELTPRAVVLAGGPFTDALRARAGLGGGWIRATRGSHILVARERLPTDGAVIFPSPVDGRIMFLIPWPRGTVIGTTDLDAASDAPVHTTRAEVQYLLDSANGLVPGAALGEADVLSSWAGLRPLLAAENSPSARSREERVAHEGSVYTIAGGKLTAFRSMAERLGARVAADLGRGDAARHSPTRVLRLRGAFDAPVARPDWSRLDASGHAPRARDAIVPAWQRRYAALVPAVQEFCGRVEQGRSPLDAETLLGEVDWAVRHEDCLGARDFFLRRTDLGHGPRAEVEAARERVLERLASALTWSSARLAEERADLARALAAGHLWRTEGARAPLLEVALKPL
ncbi:MAG: glycerol-3-phosphate dehydrogenase/oxidase [Planctomycetes bacterium]|nr:glycerol-3-phosphate dehydrogenase/oxidase [Planctomycetota bacterium]